MGDQVTREARAQAFTAAAKQFRKYDDFNCQEFSRRQKRIEDVLQVMETKKEREREEKIRQMEIEQKLKREKILADEEKAREDREKIRSEKETKENAQAYFDYKLEELKKDEKALVWSEHIDTEDCMTTTIEEIAEKQLEGVKKQR